MLCRRARRTVRGRRGARGTARGPEVEIHSVAGTDFTAPFQQDSTVYNLLGGKRGILNWDLLRLIWLLLKDSRID